VKYLASGSESSFYTSYSEGNIYYMKHIIDETDSSSGINYYVYDSNWNLLASATGKAFAYGSPSVHATNIVLGDGTSYGKIDARVKYIFFKKYADTEPSWSNFGSWTTVSGNTAPYVLSNSEVPANGTTNVDISTNLSVTVVDDDGDTMNVSFYWHNISYHNWNYENSWKIIDNSNHSAFPSLIKLENGTLLLAYRQSSGGHAGNGDIYITRSHNNGHTWEESQRIFTHDNSSTDLRDPQLILMPNGSLFIVFGDYNPSTSHHWGLRYSQCFDVANCTDSSKWTSPQWFDSDDHDHVVAMSSHPILKNDTYYCPTWGYGSGGDYQCYLHKIENNGSDISFYANVTETTEDECDEWSVIELSNGTWMGILRDTSRSKTYKKYSTDNGATWGSLIDITSDVPTNAIVQDPELTYLEDGTLQLAGRDDSVGAYDSCTVAWISHDDGETWERNQLQDNSMSDGGYTSTVMINDTAGFLVYYAGSDTGDADLYGVNITRGEPASYSDVYIGTDTNVANNTNASISVNLAYNTSYRWFVRVDDGNGSNITSDWWIFTTVGINNAPTISNPYPSNGSTGVGIQPQCHVDVSDSDGDTMTVYWYENTTGSWVLQQTNSSVSNGTYYWTYTNASSYDTTYWWKVAVNDGTDNTTAIYHFTTATNEPPQFSNENPSNGSTNQPLSLTWSIDIIDPDGDTFNWTIECSNGQSNSGNDDTNGTKSLSLSGLSYNTNYTIWVNATDSGSGEWTNATYWFITTSGSPPTQSNPSPSDGATDVEITLSQLSIDISDPEGDTFNWTIETSPNIGSASGNNENNGTKTCSVSGLNYGTTYTWYVNVTDGNSWNNQSYTFTTRDAYTPANPSDFTATTDSRFQITLTWIDDSKADSTLVEYSLSSDATWNRGDHTQLYNGTAETYVHDNLLPGTTYYYKAWSYNATDNVWSSGTTTSNTTKSNNLPTLSNESPSNGSINQNLSLTWSISIADADGDSFNWSIECSNGQSNSDTNDVNGTKTLSLSGLSYTTEYKVWVNATDGYDWTREWYTFTTREQYIPDPPSSFTATAVSSSQIDLSWAKGTNASTTYIERNTISSWNRGEGTLIYNDTSTSYSDTGLNAGTTYYYQAWSYNATDNVYSTINWIGLDFDGSNDDVRVPDDDSLNFTSSFSVDMALWVEDTPADGKYDAIISKMTDANTGWGIALYSEDGIWELQICVDGHNQSVGTASIPINKWVYPTVVFNNTTHTMHVYINGNEVYSYSEPNTASANTADLVIGECSYVGNDKTFDGKIDYIRVYNKTLTEQQIKYNFYWKDSNCTEDGLVSWWKFDENTGTTASDSWGSNDGTLEDGVVWTSGTKEIFSSDSEETQNAAPVISNPYPGNASTGVELQPVCHIQVNDSDGDSMNLYWYNSTDGTSFTLQQVNSSIGNGTYYWNYSMADTNNAVYYWKIAVNDSIDNVSAVYHFTTETSVGYPVVVTNDSTGVEETNATLWGYLEDDGNETCTVWFEYGTTTGYGNVTVNQTATSGDEFSGVNPQILYVTGQVDLYPNFDAYPTQSFDNKYKNIDDIAPDENMTYLYNNDDNTWNDIVLYIDAVSNYTIKKVVACIRALNTNPENNNDSWVFARIRGGIIPSEQHLNTSYYKYYNFTVYTYNASDPLTSEDCDIVSVWVYNENSSYECRITQVYVVVEYDTISLEPGVLYHYRAVANNSKGTVYGSDKTFLTKPYEPSNLTVSDYNNSHVTLSWNKGNGANKTIIRRSTVGYPSSPQSGTEVYNGTGTSFDDTTVTAGSKFYYRAWSYSSWNGLQQFSDNNVSVNITLPPEPPQNISYILNVNGTTGNLTINWTKGSGADRTVIARSSSSYPTSPTSGVIYNDTGENYTDSNINQPYYYTLWSYNSTSGLYSNPVYLQWFAIWLNCYDEYSGEPINNWSVFISNDEGTETYTATNCANSQILNTSLCPHGESIAFKFTASGYKMRLYYTDIDEETLFVLNAYLPPAETPSEGGGETNDTNISTQLYLINVINVYDSAIENVKMTFKHYDPATENYVDTSVLYTDANGQVEIYLIPGDLYKVKLEKEGYQTKTEDYIPSLEIYTHTFRLYFESTTPSPPVNETLWDNITVSIYPSQVYWNTSITMGMNISSADGKLEWFAIDVYKYNNLTGQWVLLHSDNETTSTGGNLSYTTSNETGKYKMIWRFKKQNFSEYSSERIYYIYIKKIQVEEEFPPEVWMLITIFFALAATGFLIKFGAGDLSGLAGIVVMGIMFGIYPVTIAGVSCWLILFATVLGYGIAMFLVRSRV